MPTRFWPRCKTDPVGGRLKGYRILVTRPRPFDEEACELIRSEGGDAIALPAIAIEAQTARARATGYDWVIFVSRNAVKHGHALLQMSSVRPRLAAVGGATAAELEQLGFSAVLRPASGFTSEALLNCAELNTVAGQRILIVRGDGGRELLAETLGERGGQVEYAEVYRRVQSCPSAARLAEIRRLLAAASIDFVAVGSIEILEALMALLGRPATALLSRTRLVTASERVVKKAGSLGLGRRILLASGPQDALLVDTIANEPAAKDTT